MCISIAQFKLIIRLRKWYTVYYVLKYRTGDLITIYHCIYFRLLGTIRDVVWNSIELMRGVGSGPQVDG